jgi:hypothetical protein
MAHLGYLADLGVLSGVPSWVPPLSSMLPNVAAAMQQVLPQNTLRDSPAYNQTAYKFCLSAVENGYLPDYQPGISGMAGATFTGGTQGCQTSTSQLKSQILSAVGGGALTVGSKVVLIPGAQLPGAIVLAVGAVLTAIGTIFGNHSKAVAKERGTLCAAVPMANAALQQLDEWLSSGQITATTAAQALQSLLSSFKQEVAGIYQTTNEAGGYYRALQGIVIRRTLDLQQAAAGSGGTAEAFSLQTGIPPVVMYAGIGLLIWYLL